MRKLTPALSLLSVSLASAATVYYNYAGYDAEFPKSLVVGSIDVLTGGSWTIVPKNGGSAVASGSFDYGSRPSDWRLTEVFYPIDFSDVRKAGTYTLSFTENGSAVSQDLEILDDALAERTLEPVLSYFRNDRNTDLDIAVSVYGSRGKTRDVHGGWNDASGDVSKYLSHLSYANYLNPQQIPLTTWTLAFAAKRIPSKVAAASGETFARDEALYGADFLVRMLDSTGFFYMTVFDNWGSGERFLCAFSGQDGVKSVDYQAAFREGGGMAIAALARASTLGASGDFSPEEYFAGAERAFAHLQKKQSTDICAYCDDGKENIIDDYTALLAACELYDASRLYYNSAIISYLEIARYRAKRLVSRLSADGYFFSDDAGMRPFWHASDAGLPLVALIRYLELEPDRSVAAKISGEAQKHLAWLVDVTDKASNPFGYAKQVYRTGDSLRTGYFIPHDNEAEYWWQGESARIASLAAAVVYASRALDYSDSLSAFGYAADQLDWILGKNPYGISFMEGVGKNNPPAYKGTLGKGMLKGGIANGITGKNSDGSGIIWNDVAGAGFYDSWQNWRWIERWLPHSTWYLMALAARYDETSGETATKIFVRREIPGFAVSLSNRTLRISAKSSLGSVKIFGIDGREVLRETSFEKSAEVSLERMNPGIYMVKVGSLGARKIVLR